MTVEIRIIDTVSEGAFNKNRPQGACVDFRGSSLPYTFVARFEGDRVRLQISEYDNLFTSAVVAEEEGRAFNCGQNRFVGIGRE